MGRRKLYSRRFLIGLDRVQVQNLVDMSNALGLTYSEVVGYLLSYYQLGKTNLPANNLYDLFLKH